MSALAIQVDGVSKRYRLGQINTTTLRDDVKRWWAAIRRQPDPTLKVGCSPERATREIWALRDVAFDVPRGQALGIIGRNGAGKSTLLKILSRITAPTTGEVRMRGRIASLLEIGTGFHGELTGRENIYLNGAVLGMTRDEVRGKLDEIVAFSGCERFIDTPVKRYSSGMTVRLGFAVAAHLEPEILIVDEVLAVGDAEFQKRCLGKMRDVAGRGRTVLFVSHNMAAVEAFCTRTLRLEAGVATDTGPTAEVVARYLASTQDSLAATFSESNGPDVPRIESARLESGPGRGGDLSIRDPLRVVVDYWNPVAGATLHLNLLLYAEDGACVLNSYSDAAARAVGRHHAVCTIPPRLLNARSYSIRLLLVQDFSHPLCDLENVLTFTLSEGERELPWYGHWPGVVRPDLTWVTRAVPQ